MATKKRKSNRPRSSGRPAKPVPVPDPKAGARGPILVPLPGEPTAEALAEAAHFVETLEANRQIARGSGPLSPGATHRIERDARGTKRLVRKRFSAL